MVDTTDLAAPLARLWRDVYRKAAEVAEGRTTEQLKTHVYVYHPNGAGGGGGGEDTGPWVDEAGDTMTGPLIHQGVVETDNVVRHQLPADTDPRFRVDVRGFMEWGPGGTTDPGFPNGPYLGRSGAYNALEVGGPLLVTQVGSWLRLTAPGAYVELPHGTGHPALSGSLRLVNGTSGAIAWRNAANSADLPLTVNASDELTFNGLPIGGGGGGGTGNTTMYTQTTAPAGAANSLWFNPSESA